MGPKQRSFNVKDKNEIEFKPHQMVSDITQIYLNLGDNEAFCMAVSADGRSYSPELFIKTNSVLQKIGKSPTMISQVDSLRDKIEVNVHTFKRYVTYKVMHKYFVAFILW